MRQRLSFVLIMIAALLVLGAKVIEPKPGSPRGYFTSVKTAVPSGIEEFSERVAARVTSAIVL
jgi:hypothetical protein